MSARTIHHPATSELDLATILRTLGDPVRLSILAQLDDGQEHSCRQLGDAVGLPDSTLSYHLRQLREAGLTRARAEGTVRFMRLREDDLEARFPGLVEAVLQRAPVLARAAR